MPKTLTDADLAELAEILEKLEYRLVTTDHQMLAEAAHGVVLTPENSFQLLLQPEIDSVRRVKAMLGGVDAQAAQEQAEKSAVRRGIAETTKPPRP